MREFVNLNISRSIQINLDKDTYQDASHELIKFPPYLAILITILSNGFNNSRNS